MSGSDRLKTTIDEGAFAEAKPPCFALVPVVEATRWSPIPSGLLLRSDSTFVTHLIATAEHVPQTRSLRRATPADAQNAYAHQLHAMSAGHRTRRTV
jgi:hypothetical protein